MDEALVRLGLALYRETRKSGEQFYSVHDLIFEHISKSVSQNFFQRIFHGYGGDFWAKEEALAKGLVQTGVADHFSRPIPGEPSHREYSLKLTTYGRAIYDLAHADNARAGSIAGTTIDDVSLVLRDSDAAAALANEIEKLTPEIEKLQLTNFQRATVNGYVQILIVAARMPDPEVKLFWIVLERLNQFAGVGSLIVALIALKLMK